MSRQGAEGLLRELGELGPLLGGHRGEHPLGGGGPRCEGVDQLVDVLRVLGEELAVLLHELAELLSRVVATGVRREQVAEVAQHLLDPLAVLRRGVLEGLLHAGEALVEQLAPEEVLDLLVLLAGVRAAPLVVGELHDGRRRGRRSPSIRISANRASSSRSRASCLRSARTASSSSFLISSRVPPSWCFWSSSRRRCATCRASTRPAHPGMPCPASAVLHASPRAGTRPP